MNPPATILRTASLLRVWLTVLQVASLVVGGLFGLGILVVGVLMLAGSSLISPFRSDFSELSELSRSTLIGIGALMVLLGLLYLAFAALYAVLIGWAKEWEGQTARLSTGQGGNVTRVAALSKTLNGWITTSQWAPIVIFGLLLIGVVAGSTFLTQLFAAGDNSEDARFVGPLIGWIYGFSILIGGGAQAVVGWLVLAAIRRFMNAVTERLRGAAVAITPSAGTVGTWFMVLMVLVGIGGGFLLLYLPFLALIGVGASQDSSRELSGLTGGLAYSGVSLVFSLASYVLMFFVLLWSRGFALAMAAQLDSGLVPSGAVAPVSDAPIASGYTTTPLN